VTDPAVQGKSCGLVIRLFNGQVIFFVALVTVYLVQPKTFFAVAVQTVQSFVYAVERIPGIDAMVPFTGRDIFPGKGSVAFFALCSETQLKTVILTAVPMAGFAICRSSFEDEIQMAFGTGDYPVASGEWEIGFVMTEK